MRERETECDLGRGRGRRRHRIQSRFQAQSCQHESHVGLQLRNHKMLLNQLSQPGAPVLVFRVAGAMTFKPRFSLSKQIGFLCVSVDLKLNWDHFLCIKGVTSTLEGQVEHFWITLIVQSSERSSGFPHNLSPPIKSPFLCINCSNLSISEHLSHGMLVFIYLTHYCNRFCLTLLSECKHYQSREHTCFYSCWWHRPNTMSGI